MFDKRVLYAAKISIVKGVQFGNKLRKWKILLLLSKNDVIIVMSIVLDKISSP